MKRVIVCVMCLLGLATFAVAQPELFSLSPVIETQDAVACAEAGGKAALVAPLAADGSLAQPFESFCLLAYKP